MGAVPYFSSMICTSRAASTILSGRGTLRIRLARCPVGPAITLDGRSAQAVEPLCAPGNKTASIRPRSGG